MKISLWPLLAALWLLPAAGAVAQQSSAKPADCGPLPADWTGTAFAIDGDTLAGVGLKPHIRIWGIQAPELRDAAKQETVPGMRARASLDDLLAPAGNKVTCRIAKFDRYCRIVAQCTANARGPASTVPIDIGAQMLVLGQAYGFYLEDTLPWDTDAGTRYIGEERAARERKRGLWQEWMPAR